MNRSFSRKIDAPAMGVGACAPCAAKARALAESGSAGYGSGALSDDDKRSYLTYGFIGSVAVGAVGFFGGYPIAATVGLIGTFGAMAGLAIVPQKVVES